MTLNLPPMGRFAFDLAIAACVSLLITGTACNNSAEPNGAGGTNGGTGGETGSGGSGGADEPVPEPVGTIAGVVVDGSQTAVEGATVQAAEETTTTDADGTFALEVVLGGDSSLVLEITKTGHHGAHVAVAKPAADGDLISAGTILLAVVQATATAAAGMPTEVNTDDGLMRVTAPDGALPPGTQLQITRLPPSTVNLSQRLASSPTYETEALGEFWISTDDDTQPSEEVDLAIGVEGSVPADVEVVVARTEPATAACSVTAVARTIATVDSVLADTATAVDSVVQISVNHFSAFTISAPMVPAADSADPKADDGTLSIGQFPKRYPRAHPVTGALQVGLDIEHGFSDNQPAVWTLFYDSQTVLPSATITAAQLYDGLATPMSARFAASVFGKTRSVRVSASSWDNQNETWRAGRYRMRFEAKRPGSAAWLPSGAYTYGLRLGLGFTGTFSRSKASSANDCAAALEPGEPTAVETPVPVERARVKSGTVAVLNRRDSPFGRGWWIWGLPRLFDQGDLVLLDPGNDELPGIYTRRSTWHSTTVFDRMASSMPPLNGEPFTERDASLWFAGTDGERFIVTIPLPTTALAFDPSQAAGVSRVAGTTTPYTENHTPADSPTAAIGLRIHITAVAADPATGDIYLDHNGEVVWRIAGGTASVVLGNGHWSDPPMTEGAVATAVGRSSSSRPGVFWGRDGKLYFDHNDEVWWLEDGMVHKTAFAMTHGAAVDSTGLAYVGSETGCITQVDSAGTATLLTPACDQPRPTTAPDHVSEARFGNIRSLKLDGDENLWVLTLPEGVVSTEDGQASLWRIGADGSVLHVAGDEGGREDCIEPECDDPAGPAPSTRYRAEDFAVTDDGHVLIVGRWGFELKLLSPDTGAFSPTQGANGNLFRQEGQGWSLSFADGKTAEFDERGLLTSRTVQGSRSESFVWDDGGRLTRYDSPAGRQTQFSYDANGLRSVQTPVGTWTLEHQDGELERINLPGGDHVAYEYDPSGSSLLTSRTDTAGNKTHYTWNEDGLLETVQLPGRDTLTYELEHAIGRVDRDVDPVTGTGPPINWQVIEPASFPNGRGGTFRVTSDQNGYRLVDQDDGEIRVDRDQDGNIRRLERPDGTVLEYIRNSRGQIVMVKNRTADLTWRYARDHTGRILSRKAPGDEITTYRYTASGRIRSRQGPTLLYETWSYDAEDRVSETTATIDGQDFTRTYTYDPTSGNLTSIHGPGSDVTGYEVDAAGRVTRITDPGGYATSRTYGADGLVDTIQAPGGLNRSQEMVRTGYSWLEAGPPVLFSLSETDSAARKTTFTSDAQWAVTSTSTPWSGALTRTYDVHGRLETETNALAETTTTTYDPRGRVAGRAFDDGTSISFERDANGRVQKASNLLGELSLIYDTAGRITSTTVTSSDALLLGATLTHTVSDPLSRNTSGGALAFTINFAAGQTTGIELGVSPTVTIVRAGDGRPKRIDYPGGVTSTFLWDAQRRLSQVDHVFNDRTDTYGTTFDGSGRLLNYTEPGGSGTRTWDPAGRLTEDSRSGASGTAESFTYTAGFALSEMNGNTFVRDAAGRLTNDGVYDYAWDAAGRRATKTNAADPTWQDVYTWNARGLLAGVLQKRPAAADHAIVFHYDALGRRVARDAGGEITRWVWDVDGDRLLEEHRPGGTLLAFVVDPNDGRLWIQSVAGAVWAARHDSAGSVLALGDSTGNSGARYRYSAYGRRQRVDATGTPDCPFGFHGMYLDASTGLYLTPARAYDPVVGEFLSPDPEGAAGGPNPYIYAGGAPGTFVDPSGRFLGMVAMGALAVGGSLFYGMYSLTSSSRYKQARQDTAKITNLKGDGEGADQVAEQRKSGFFDTAGKALKWGVDGLKSATDTVINPAKTVWDVAKTAAGALAEAVVGGDENAGSNETAEPPEPEAIPEE